MGWRDVTRIEGPGKGGAFVHKHQQDLSKLTDEQLAQLYAIHESLEAASALPEGPAQDGDGQTQH
jgi:hypothetical protein